MKIDKEKFPARLKELMEEGNENTYTLAEFLHLSFHKEDTKGDHETGIASAIQSPL